MDFSIITPSYNYGHYISECLASVAEQDGIIVEHLVMDACSTDNTADVVAKFSHAQFFQEPDKGMSDGINKGFLKAKGKWVMWLNADDRLKPGALRSVKEFADNQPDADVIYGCWNFMDAEGNFQRRMSLFPFVPGMISNFGCYIASTSTFFRRETTIAQGHLLNVRFGTVMDGEYYCRLNAEGKRFKYLPRVIADFRLHEKSISQKNIGKEDINSVLAYQLQLAESRASRRVYGIKLFKDEMLNCIVEAIFFHFYRIIKFLLRILYARKTIDTE
jgi:glycosyltransferase involved in cell wall biosynthesis